jgi:hypothetical protein
MFSTRWKSSRVVCRAFATRPVPAHLLSSASLLTQRFLSATSTTRYWISAKLTRLQLVGAPLLHSFPRASYACVSNVAAQETGMVPSSRLLGWRDCRDPTARHASLHAVVLLTTASTTVDQYIDIITSSGVFHLVAGWCFDWLTILRAACFFLGQRLRADRADGCG